MKQRSPSLKILSEKEKNQIEKKLNERFGIEEVKGTLISIGKERIFLFNGEISEKDLKKLEDNIPIERAGVYFAKLIHDEIKLSIEGVQILKEQIKKNIFQLDDSQLEDWMKGHDLQLATGLHGFLIIKYKEDFLGCGKASQDKIGNFIPKSRRLKEKA
jgi:NOL1/NOP2/fmu family ribosome biogenesis protein